MVNRIKMTPQKKAKFVRALEELPNVAHACRATSITRSTAYEHKATDEKFSAAWDDAIETSLDKMEQVAWERAKRDKNPSDTLLIFMLKGYRKKFSDRVELSDPDGKNPLIPLANALKEALAK